MPSNRNNSDPFSKSDIWAGLAASAVVLPQAMAFGVALLAPLGIPAATGALAGLIGAAALNLTSGIAGGTRGLISSPTGPTLVLMAAALKTLGDAGMENGGILMGMAALLALTGIFQILIGLSGGGKLIKFIPFPVVAGFMSGSAILMILSQINPLTGSGISGEWRSHLWMPVGVAAATYGLIALVPKKWPAIPGTIAGLLGGTMVFHLLALLGPGPVPEKWMIGSLPGPDAIKIGLSVSDLSQIPWTALCVSAAALAVLASLDTLLTSVIADVGTGSRHNARRELIGQGVGQALAGLIGGMAGAGTTGATVVAVKTHGRRWTGVAAGLSFVLLVVAAGPVGQVLPISVLAGVILHVAAHMLDFNMFRWIKRRNTRVDAGIAFLVTAVTVGYDLMAAVGVGVLIAVVLFIRAQVKAPVIHRRSTSGEQRSSRSRPSSHYEALEAHGDRIKIFELEGQLFFATADRLFSELSEELDHPAWIVLHLQRVRQIDLTGMQILKQIADRLRKNGGQLIFCNLHRGLGLGKKMQKTFKKIAGPGGKTGVKTFNGADEALEYAEDALLKELGIEPTPLDERASLRDFEVCAGLTPPQIGELERALKPIRIKKGKKLFQSGDHGEEMYFLIAGEIDVRLPTTEHHHKRLAHYGPGSQFGEIAMLEPGPRAADAVAVVDSELLALDQEGLATMSNESEPVAIGLLKALGGIQARNLRWSADEIRRLAQW